MTDLPTNDALTASAKRGRSSANSTPRGRTRHLLGVLARTLGWVSFGLIGLGLIAENLPGAERLIVKAVQGRVGGALSENLAIEDLDVLWLRRAVAFEGITTGPNGDDLQLSEIVCRVGWSASRGFHVDRVTVSDGSITVSEALAAGFEAPTEEKGSTFDALQDSPEVVVRDFAITLAPADVEPLRIGSVDVCMKRGPGGHPEIIGRLVPALGVASDPSGVIWLNGSMGPDRAIEIDGIARSLAINFDAIPANTPLASVKKLDPEALIDLSCTARFQPDQSILPTVSGTLSVSNGSLQLPWIARSEQRRVEDVDLAAEIAFDPAERLDPFDPDSWSAQGRLLAEWEDLSAASGFRFGRSAPEGMVFDAWADLPDAPLGEQLIELVAAERGIQEIESMLEPRGSADVSIGLRLPRSAPGTPDREGKAIAHALQRMISIRPRGNASLSYHGGVDRRTGRRDIGFPLPVERVSGDITWSIHPLEQRLGQSHGHYQGQLAFYDATGYHGGGPVAVQGSLNFTPVWMFPSRAEALLAPAPFHLKIESQGLPIDSAFYRAMKGLAGAVELHEILPVWSPQGGQIDFDLEMWRRPDQRDLAILLDADLQGVNARWEELGVPIDNVHGNIKVLTDGGGPEAGHGIVTLDVEADTTVARDPVRARGRISSTGELRSVSWIEVDAKRVNPLSAELLRELDKSNPDVLRTMESTGASGSVDMLITAVQAIPFPDSEALRRSNPNTNAFLGGLKVTADIQPTPGERGLTLQPPDSALRTREVEGLLRTTVLFPPENPLERAERIIRERSTGKSEEGHGIGPMQPAVATVSRMQGIWTQTGPSVPVISKVMAAPDGNVDVEAFGAGLDLANKPLLEELVGALRTASANEPGAAEPIDTGSFDIAGRLDFGATFTLTDDVDEPLRDTRFGVEARLDKLAIGGNQVLRDVSAHLRYVEETGEWVGEEIDAKLARTPVKLRDVAWTPGEDESVFHTRLSARELPIDEEHLGFFLDPATRRIVLEDLSARGNFDLDDAELTIRRSNDGAIAVHLRGKLGVKDAFVDLGAPVELMLVESVELDLRHEGQGLRARADIKGAYGAIAGRRLENARMGLTYIEPRLVIEGLDGGFEGGRLRAIGANTSPAANLFTIDLAPPFPFRLSAAMDDVDIGKFLRGVFDSDFANRGIMDLDMQLSGDFEHLTGMTGGGTIRVEDSALWAIPVFQALSTRLGIDTTVLFRTMLCDYTVEGGKLVLDRMRVDSDLLSLVGEGAISFEGGVTSDLEVRYALVDKLGPFTRLLYRIQNSLLRVSIRGTMERPTVVLRGLISQFFSPDKERDRLPLPGFSKRPSRF